MRLTEYIQSRHELHLTLWENLKDNNMNTLIRKAEITGMMEELTRLLDFIRYSEVIEK